MSKRLRKLDSNSAAGFSLIELLIAAFIMSVGLLGLAALENIALQSNTRSRGYNTGVLVANHVLESVESQARQKALALANGDLASNPKYTADDYFSGNPITETFTFRGLHPDSTATDPVDKTAYFTAVTTATAPFSGVTGVLTPVTTVVTFQESSNQSGKLVTRTITLTRNLFHG